LHEQIVEYIAKALVDHPDAVQVRTIEGDKSLIFELRVDKSDIGKVIGRQGRTARAIRTVLRNVSGHNGKLIHVEILD
jgi:predicted RNA-binding protein YlqC (UPF0109 family)